MREAAAGDDTLRSRVLTGRTLRESQGVRMDLLDVETPEGATVERTVVRLPRVAAGLIIDEQERVLLCWRHRFVRDGFGWELPAGEVEPDEHAAVTAVRAVLEETGWRPASPMVHLLTCLPAPGGLDAPHEVYMAEGAARIRPDAARPGTPGSVSWVPLAMVPELVGRGEIVDAGSLAGLLYALSLRAKRA